MKFFLAELNFIYLVAIAFYIVFSILEQNKKKRRLEDLAAEKKERERIQMAVPKSEPRPPRTESVEEILRDVFGTPAPESEHEHRSSSPPESISEHESTTTEHQGNISEHLNPTQDSEEKSGEARGLNSFEELRKESLLASSQISEGRSRRKSAQRSIFKSGKKEALINAIVWSEIMRPPLAKRNTGMRRH